jgi:hypothetical protein
MSYTTQIRETIKEIILQQESLAYNGGMSRLELRWLNVLKRRLFRTIGLHYDEATFESIFDYPFCPMLDIEDPCSLMRCNELGKKLRNRYVNNSLFGLVRVWGVDAKQVDLEYKVRCVLQNLSFFTGEIYD